MNIDKFEEAYIRSNAQMAFIIAEGKYTKTQQKKAARDRKGERLERKIAKKGGTVAGVDISPEAGQHLSNRGQGSKASESPLRGAIRQLKQAGRQHRKGQIAVTTDHGKKTGTELVRPKSEIPDKDIVKTDQVTKPNRGEDVQVDRVHTNKPSSHYSTTKGFSAAGPKDPKFMNPRSLKRRVGGKLKDLQGRALKKRLKNKTLYTYAPGRSAPPVDKWKDSGHAVIKPNDEN